MFQKATKQSAKLRLAITGVSGSGKTFTALTLASFIAQGKPIALVDTENGSASKYADKFDFDVAEMHAPFDPAKFIKAISEASSAGYGVIILDSLSHAWMGTGGILDIVDEAAKRSKSGNTYMAWKEGTPIQNKLIEAIVQSPIHVIATMRSKSEYVLETNERGKQAPKKIGLAAIQREGVEFEFDIVLQMTADNDAIVEKTRCSDLANRVFSKPGQELAGVITTWLGGESVPVEQKREASKPAQQKQQPVQARKQPSDFEQAAKSAAMAKMSDGAEWQKWQSGDEAKAYAVNHGWCANEFEARNSLLNSLEEVTQQKAKWFNDKQSDVFKNFYDKHINRQSEQKQAA